MRVGFRRSLALSSSAARHRGLCTAADTVTVTIQEARSKTAAALQKIGWDDEDAALQAEIMTAAEHVHEEQVPNVARRRLTGLCDRLAGCAGITRVSLRCTSQL